MFFNIFEIDRIFDELLMIEILLISIYIFGIDKATEIFYQAYAVLKRRVDLKENICLRNDDVIILMFKKLPE